jgi:hypothetical protein
VEKMEKKKMKVCVSSRGAIIVCAVFRLLWVVKNVMGVDEGGERKTRRWNERVEKVEKMEKMEKSR